MSSGDIVRVILVIVPLVDLAAMLVLWGAVRGAGGWRVSPAWLRHGLFTSCVIWLGSSLLATVALLGLLHVSIDPEMQLWLVVIALVLPSLANAALLWRYWHGFDGAGRAP